MKRMKIMLDSATEWKGEVRSCADVDNPYLFISYCHDDQEKVMGLLQLLQENHFRFWFDEGIQGGFHWEEVLHERIVKCAQFVCFLSQKAVASEYVKDEIHLAKKHGIHMLIVMLDDVTLRGGLELMLDRRQTLSAASCTREEFSRQLCRSLDRHTIICNTESESRLPEILQDRYHITSQLGGGFSGEVYLAENRTTGGKVVIKHTRTDSSYTGQAIRISYRNECRALAQQISPQAPVVFDFITEENGVFLVESFVRGTPLQKLNGLDDRKIVEIFRRTARVLQDFHENGVIHCDVKPEHIFVRGEQVFLVDFGACQFLGEPSEHYTIGTIHFAAPEQFPSSCSSELVPAVDCRADIYALGKSLLFVLAENHGILEIREQDQTMILDGKTTFFTKKDTYVLDVERYCDEVHPLLRSVVDKMIAAEKDYRFRSMKEVITCLDSFLEMNL